VKISSKVHLVFLPLFLIIFQDLESSRSHGFPPLGSPQTHNGSARSWPGPVQCYVSSFPNLGRLLSVPFPLDVTFFCVALNYPVCPFPAPVGPKWLSPCPNFPSPYSPKQPPPQRQLASHPLSVPKLWNPYGSRSSFISGLLIAPRKLVASSIRIRWS